ncbi:hypothetical protein BDY19DRAFT_907786 [Irpex rosettiformis]|uniref:Uncharacterized protein n=1 Tax=Irpex rosettiformis TaxID=378272 RepID=A0ACB8TXT9_9APHY|nr:hypothetical protein BDY19DRAFT_907786 [Irpex rosettiformis]
MESQAGSPSPLPIELMVEILENLNYRDLLNCRLVSRSFRDTIDHTDSTQYKISLASAGMSDNPLNATSKHRKHELLRQHHVKWSSRSKETVLDESEIPGKKTYPVRKTGSKLELVGGVLAQNANGNTIEFVRLPSISRGIQEEIWTVQLPCSHLVFTMDPGQDLLVIVEPRNLAHTIYGSGEVDIYVTIYLVAFPLRTTDLYFLSMSTGEPYPDSHSPILAVPAYHFGRFKVDINGPYIGFFAEQPRPHLPRVYVWNWVTGEAQCCIESADNRKISSYVFLDDTRILLALQQNEINSPSSRPLPPRNAPRLEIVGFRRNAMVDRWILLLPPLKAGVEFVRLLLSCEPGPLNIPPPSDKPPFHLFDVAESGQSGERVVMFIMSPFQNPPAITTSFLSTKLLNIPLAFPAADDGVSWVEWQQWGPSTVHMDIMPNRSGLWQSITYGTKTISLRSYNNDVDAKIVVRDFARGAARREELCPAETHETHETLGLTSDVSNFIRTRVFDEDVKTFLPYTEFEISGRVTPRDQVMLSEDSVVFIEISHPDLSPKVFTRFDTKILEVLLSTVFPQVEVRTTTVHYTLGTTYPVD